MKIRTGFVINSSSSFTVFQVILKDGRRLEEHGPEIIPLMGEDECWDSKERLEEIQGELNETVSRIQSVREFCQWLYELNDSEAEDDLPGVDRWDFAKNIQEVLGETLESLAAVRVLYGEDTHGEDVEPDDEIESCFGLSDLSDICEEECYVTDYTQGVEILVDFTKEAPDVRVNEDVFSLELANGIRIERLEDGRILVESGEEHAVLPEEEVQAFVESMLENLE